MISGSEAEGFVGPHALSSDQTSSSSCPATQPSQLNLKRLHDCIQHIQENGFDNDICFDVVETPISTKPSMFTTYQAKSTANLVFKHINRIYRKIDAEQYANKQAKAFQRGLEQSSQHPPKRFSNPTFLPTRDVIDIPELVAPSENSALSSYIAYSGMLHVPLIPISLRTCTTIDSKGSTCQRAPLQDPESFCFSTCYNKLAAVTLAFILPSQYEENGIEHSRRSFPPNRWLKPQTFHEVDLPPPESSRT